MKRKITLLSLAAMLLSANALKAQQNFTAGNLVVVRVGDGVADMSTNASAIYLDEYKTTGGARVQTVQLPTATSAPNYGIVVSGMSGAGNGTTQGFPTLSPDGKYLLVPGYDAAVGSTLADLQNAATGRVFAMVSNGVTQPVINTTTRVVIGNADNRVAVTSDGNSIWFGGTGGGVQYTTLGSNSSTAISTAPTATRGGGLDICNGQLYQSTNTTDFRIVKIGDGLPTVPVTTVTNLDGIPRDAVNSNAPGQDLAGGFVLFDINPTIPGNDLLYFVSDLNGTDGLTGGHLRKYVRTAISGENWVFAGGVSAANPNNVAKVSVSTDVTGLRSLIGTLENGVPTLYAASNNRVIKVVDNAVHSADLNATITSIAVASLASKTAFRGVSFAPGTVVVLPVVLTSFTGKMEQNFVKLNWSTSSEKNNSHFEVMRSEDGKEFSKIARIEGNNNSNVAINYEFKDRKPLSTTAYYRLNQVDYDGKEKLSEIISVGATLSVTSGLTVYTSGEYLTLRFNAVSALKGKIGVYDISGQIITDKNILITKGTNEVTLPVTGIKNGKMYIALLDAEGNLQSEKFIVNRR